jgi:hypothetical protein
MRNYYAIEELMNFDFKYEDVDLEIESDHHFSNVCVSRSIICIECKTLLGFYILSGDKCCMNYIQHFMIDINKVIV